MPVEQKPGFYERFMAQADERRAKALKLRNDGKTYDEIGAALGISKQRAFDIVQRAKSDVRGSR